LNGDYAKDWEGIQFHYDLPAEFFRYFLDEGMNYTCAYFRHPEEPLDQAQQNKLALICRKLQLKPGDHVLDIGCGWGNFAFYAAEQFGCRVTGITLSNAQVEFIRHKAQKTGLSSKVEAIPMHALEMSFPLGNFDKVVTIGAIEHIPHLKKMFAECANILKDEGLMLVHGMTKPWQLRQRALDGEEDTSEESRFLTENIFPVGEMISLTELIGALEPNNFEVLDVHNITDHYTLTLQNWLENLQKNEETIKDKGIVDISRLRAQMLFLAGCVESFQENRVLCYQALARKIRPDEVRVPLALSRKNLDLAE